MYAIEMQGITKTFHGSYANKEVSLKVEQGEIHSLLGENGAGKTTLMKILFGLYKADKGRILINGGPYPSGGAGALCHAQAAKEGRQDHHHYYPQA